jgi:arginine utilization protein RocB
MLICMGKKNWFHLVRDYTERLVAIRSVSPGRGEIQVAQAVLDLLHADELDTIYAASGLDLIEGDPYQRQNVYAFLRGKLPITLVLLGHIDTVDTTDYGSLERWALTPDELAKRAEQLLTPEQVVSDDAGDWMFGRGAADMKSGVAVNIALMRQLAAQTRDEPLPFSVVMLATPDEENESVGVLQGVRFLLRLREQYGLNYIGVINTDYATALYPGDPHHYIYAGTVGKLLPSFLCIGRESHVGTPFQGLDANLIAAELIRDLSMNDALCDAAGGLLTAPPVTLHATDLKTHYDVQLPFMAYFYLNVLTLTTEPGDLLAALRQRCQTVLEQMLQRIDATERRWRQTSGQMIAAQESRSATILAYAEVYAETVQKLGEERVRAALSDEWERWPGMLDKRERSLHLVRRLWALSGRQGPAVVIYYSPPYYPHVAATPSLLQDAITAVISTHPEQQLVQREYFPLLSDMSYLQLAADADLTALTTNMPVWEDAVTAQRPGSYSLPLEEMQRLGVPVFNWGVHGRGAHQRDESVQMSYSFEALPQLLYETIEQLALLIDETGEAR